MSDVHICCPGNECHCFDPITWVWQASGLFGNGGRCCDCPAGPWDATVGNDPPIEVEEGPEL